MSLLGSTRAFWPRYGSTPEIDNLQQNYVVPKFQSPSTRLAQVISYNLRLPRAFILQANLNRDLLYQSIRRPFSQDLFCRKPQEFEFVACSHCDAE